MPSPLTSSTEIVQKRFQSMKQTAEAESASQQKTAKTKDNQNKRQRSFLARESVEGRAHRQDLDRRRHAEAYDRQSTLRAVIEMTQKVKQRQTTEQRSAMNIVLNPSHRIMQKMMYEMKITPLVEYLTGSYASRRLIVEVVKKLSADLKNNEDVTTNLDRNNEGELVLTGPPIGTIPDATYILEDGQETNLFILCHQDSSGTVYATSYMGVHGRNYISQRFELVHDDHNYHGVRNLGMFESPSFKLLREYVEEGGAFYEGGMDFIIDHWKPPTTVSTIKRDVKYAIGIMKYAPHNHHLVENVSESTTVIPASERHANLELCWVLDENEGFNNNNNNNNNDTTNNDGSNTNIIENSNRNNNNENTTRRMNIKQQFKKYSPGVVICLSQTDFTQVKVAVYDPSDSNEESSYPFRMKMTSRANIDPIHTVAADEIEDQIRAEKENRKYYLNNRRAYLQNKQNINPQLKERNYKLLLHLKQYIEDLDDPSKDPELILEQQQIRKSRLEAEIVGHMLKMTNMNPNGRNEIDEDFMKQRFEQRNKYVNNPMRLPDIHEDLLGDKMELPELMQNEKIVENEEQLKKSAAAIRECAFCSEVKADEVYSTVSAAEVFNMTKGTILEERLPDNELYELAQTMTNWGTDDHARFMSQVFKTYNKEIPKPEHEKIQTILHLIMAERGGFFIQRRFVDPPAPNSTEPPRPVLNWVHVKLYRDGLSYSESEGKKYFTTKFEGARCCSQCAFDVKNGRWSPEAAAKTAHVKLFDCGNIHRLYAFDEQLNHGEQMVLNPLGIFGSLINHNVQNKANLVKGRIVVYPQRVSRDTDETGEKPFLRQQFLKSSHIVIWNSKSTDSNNFQQPLLLREYREQASAADYEKMRLAVDNDLREVLFCRANVLKKYLAVLRYVNRLFHDYIPIDFECEDQDCGSQYEDNIDDVLLIKNCDALARSIALFQRQLLGFQAASHDCSPNQHLLNRYSRRDLQRHAARAAAKKTPKTDAADSSSNKPSSTNVNADAASNSASTTTTTTTTANQPSSTNKTDAAAKSSSKMTESPVPVPGKETIQLFNFANSHSSESRYSQTTKHYSISTNFRI